MYTDKGRVRVCQLNAGCQCSHSSVKGLIINNKCDDICVGEPSCKTSPFHQSVSFMQCLSLWSENSLDTCHLG